MPPFRRPSRSTVKGRRRSTRFGPAGPASECSRMDRTKPEAPDAVMRRDTAASNDVAADASRAAEGRSSNGGVRATDLLVIVTVTRSGGIAGIHRTWRAQAEEDAASPWIARINECP